mgnify:CR=1 FL=1
MNFQQMKSIIEALLFVSGNEGLNAKQLAAVLELDEESVTAAVRDLKRDLAAQGRGIQVVELAGVYQLAYLPEHAPYLERLASTPLRSQLSQATLETLSIIAYKQPITRVDIEEIRGVKSDRAIHTLISKELIEEVGRADAVGRPILYGTTKAFLDYFGLGSLKDLPSPDNLDPDALLEEETRMLYDRFEERQLTINDIERQLTEGQHAERKEAETGEQSGAPAADD